MVFLSTEQQKRLLEEAAHTPATSWLRMAVLIALETGLRLDGVMHLKWDAIKDGVIYRKVKRDKTVKIPLTEMLKQDLAAHKASLAVPSLTWVFPSPENPNKPRSKSIQNLFQAACKRANVFVTAEDGRKKNFRFHDLRHTFATMAIKRGVRLEQVQMLLGHSSITMTRRYAHVDLDDLTAAMKLFDERRGQEEHELD